jgi:hypothetical protein
MSDELPKVTIHSTGDTAEAAAPVRKPGTITDAKGRKIVVRPVNPLEEYRLSKIMGQAGESSWARTIALQAAAVREFDGEEEDFPNSDREIEAIVQRLGAEGFEAVNKALSELAEAKPKSNMGAVKN